MRVRDALLALGVPLGIGAAALALSSGDEGGSEAPEPGTVGPTPEPGPDGPPSKGGEYWPPAGVELAPAGLSVAPLPEGKGIFVRHVHHGGTDPELFAKRCAWLGLRWVMIQAIWQYRPGAKLKTFINDASQYADYGAALRAAGVTPWVFGYPVPNAMEQFADRCALALERLGGGPGGVVINPEAEWYRGHRDDATRFVELLRETLPGVPLGMTSYGGGPWMHPPFPWAEFAACDFGLPQYYSQRLDRNFRRKATESWTKAGYRCVPVLAAYPKSRTPEEMALAAAWTPLPFGAVCWWDLYWLITVHAKRRIDFVRQYYVPEAKVA